MNRTLSNHIKLGAITATVGVLLSLIPQVHLWSVRGKDWNGAYAAIQGDEFLYSAYINALIDGRPRRNDPFAGRDSVPQSPLPESTFSIQFIPPYLIASLAKPLGLSASSVFILLLAISALLVTWSIYWLLASVTGDNKLAAVGALFVLSLGALAAGQGLIGLLLRTDVMFIGLPFLRRYQPAASFPLFFVFTALIWRALTAETARRARINATIASLTLVVLIFSYLYLWTAAAMWVVCVVLLWLYARPKLERRRGLEVLSITAVIALLAVIPYAYLLSNRASSLDEAQTLILTRQPDLFRLPEVIGAVILAALVISIRRGTIRISEPRAIFAASLGLLPFVLFNQQIITGRSMQPYHFETFVANYAVMVSVVIVATLIYPRISVRAMVWIAGLSFLWGAIEVSLPVIAHSRSNVVADQMVPVFRRLKELSNHDGTWSGLREEGRTPAVVFSPHREVMGLLPTWAPQGTLLGMGGLDFGSASQRERKEMFYAYLYYSGANADRLQEVLSGRNEDSFLNHYARIATFGHERVVPMLSFAFKPIGDEEIETEVKAYQTYIENFSRENVLLHPLTYVVTRVDRNPDLSSIDRWYERDGGEKLGDYNLFALKLRH